MPVTAKLSKAFYDTLGEQIVNELVEWFNQVDATYRSDLREVNELNFARFDARMEQRMTQIEARIDRVAAELRAEVRSEFENRFGALEDRFGALEDRFGALEGRFGALEGRFGALDGTLHRELREQTRFMIGTMVALWTALLIPIVGLWFR